MENKSWTVNDIRAKWDDRDIEIIIDCLEAGLEAYEEDGDDDGVKRITDIINSLNA